MINLEETLDYIYIFSKYYNIRMECLALFFDSLGGEDK